MDESGCQNDTGAEILTVMKKSTAGMHKIEVCLDNVGNDGAVDAAD